MDKRRRPPRPAAPRKPKSEQDRELSRDLEMTFPASDPLASTEPHGGETGPEVVEGKPTRRPK